MAGEAAAIPTATSSSVPNFPAVSRDTAISALEHAKELVIAELQ